MTWEFNRSILDRKLKWIRTTASVDAIQLNMDKWLAMLQTIQTQISLDVILRMLNELYLILNIGLDPKDFDFPPIPPWIPPGDITQPPSEGGTKAYYDVTYYDTSYFDPPEVGFKDIERYAWANRYRVMEEDQLAYKKTGAALINLLQARRSGVQEAGVADYILNAADSALAMVEGRILNGFYVGFAIVGLSKVGAPSPPNAKYEGTIPTRHPSTWTEPLSTESICAYEMVVGWAHVGYCRVGSWGMYLNKAVSDMAVQRINDFWARSAMVPVEALSQYGGLKTGEYAEQAIKTLYQRIFMLQRVDQYHYKGGSHQVRMQMNTNMIRPILDQYGITSSHRMAYTSFTHELYYLDYPGHRLYKQWKKLITADDLVEKYVKLGCDRTVLTAIRGVIKP